MTEPGLRRCPSCHRLERAVGDGVEIVVPGGQRRMVDAPALLAWRVLKRSLEGELPSVIAACPACDLPMVGEGARIPWEVITPAGKLVVTDAIVGPEGAMSIDEADRFVEGQLARPRKPIGRHVLEAVAMLPFVLLLVPFLGWIFAILYVIGFITNALPVYKPW